MIRAYTAAQPSDPSAVAVVEAFEEVGRHFEQLSAARFGLRKAMVTKWVRVRPGGGCTGAADRKHAEAVRKARIPGGAALRSFDHVVVYFPCRSSSVAGMADLSDDYSPFSGRVWLYGHLDKRVVGHELLHNQGLGHASLLKCRKDGHAVTYSRSCDLDEYGDEFDLMGSGLQLNPELRAQLGWLDGKRSLTEDGASILRPLGGSAGPQAVLVQRGSRLNGFRWWFDFRPDSEAGVLVHLGPTLIDAVPDNPAFALPAGSSLTLPGRVRVTVVSESSDMARVAVDVDAPAAQIPSPPENVVALAGTQSAAVSWTRPDDGGNPIHAYEVTTIPGNQVVVVRSAGGMETSAELTGLATDVSYRFRVRALSQSGASSATESNPVTPWP